MGNAGGGSVPYVMAGKGRGLGFEGDVEGRGQSETDKAMPPTKDDPPKEVLGSILAPAVQAGGN